jgi:hypothetical protein
MLKYKLFPVFALFLVSCAISPSSTLQNSPPPNPNAPLAYLSKGSANLEMKQEYALALQNAGYYNFVTEDVSEQQIENGIGFRLDYKEEKGRFQGIPTLVLTAEFIRNDTTMFKFTIKEASDKDNLNNPRNKNIEKKYRLHVLLARFLEEVKRTKPKMHTNGCRG